MKIYTEDSLSNFNAWSGAVDTLDTLVEKNLVDELEAELEELYPDGLSDTELNDILWFENDWIAQLVGFADWEDLERDGEPEEEED